MTLKEIDDRLTELEKEKKELLKAKQEANDKRFEELSNRVMAALQTLVSEFPSCEWVVNVNTMAGAELIDLLSRSDALNENSFSQD